MPMSAMRACVLRLPHPKVLSERSWPHSCSHSDFAPDPAVPDAEHHAGTTCTATWTSSKIAASESEQKEMFSFVNARPCIASESTAPSPT